MSQARNAFFIAMSFFFLKHRLSGLSVFTRKQYGYYYNFLQKKHFLENMVSSRPMFNILFVIYSEM
jgi:hypothetical protein